MSRLEALEALVRDLAEDNYSYYDAEEGEICHYCYARWSQGDKRHDKGCLWVRACALIEIATHDEHFNPLAERDR